jgi:hypothetical protein
MSYEPKLWYYNKEIFGGIKKWWSLYPCITKPAGPWGSSWAMTQDLKPINNNVL